MIKYLTAAASVFLAGRNSLPRTLPRYTAGALPRPPAPACPSRRDEPLGVWLRRRTVCGNPLWGPPHTGQWPAHYSRSHAFCGRSQPIDSPPFARESGCSAPPLTLHTNSPCRCGCQVPETTPTAALAAAASNRSSRALRRRRALSLSRSRLYKHVLHVAP